MEKKPVSVPLLFACGSAGLDILVPAFVRERPGRPAARPDCFMSNDRDSDLWIRYESNHFLLF